MSQYLLHQWARVSTGEKFKAGHILADGQSIDNGELAIGKNLLVAYAAGAMNVDLAKATSIGIADYTHAYSGIDSGSNCAAFLTSQARISVSYKPNLFTQCSFSVTVRKVEQVGITPDLNQPMIDITTELPVSGCSVIPIIVTPIVVKPIEVKPIPRPIPH